MSAATEYAPAVPLPRAVGVAAPRALAVVPDPAPLHGPVRRPVREPAGRRGAVGVLHAPSTPDFAAPLRLTRRGVVVLSALLAVLGGAVLWVAAASASASTHPPAAHPRMVTVAPGDTLWSIAGRAAPNRDPRAEVSALQRRNHLHGVDLVPGQRLLVP